MGLKALRRASSREQIPKGTERQPSETTARKGEGRGGRGEGEVAKRRRNPKENQKEQRKHLAPSECS